MPLGAVQDQLGQRGVAILSGMVAMAGEDYSTLESIRHTGGVVPDATWDENVAAASANARLARALGMGLVTFHAGFVPHDPADPRRRVLFRRLALLTEIFAGEGVAVALETGQESAETLRHLLEQFAPVGVGVNFDPGNIILYGMGEPVAALRQLAPLVRQIHVKDARPAARPGAWGSEVPAGEGAVDWPAFFSVLGREGIAVDLVIEREAGEARVQDVRRARELIERLLAGRVGKE
jgi:sugar phosphate isomerase/epimerase